MKTINAQFRSALRNQHNTTLKERLWYLHDKETAA